MATLEERLNDIIKEKENQIEDLRNKIGELERVIDQDWRWAIHKKAEINPPLLPVPRLQITYETIDRDNDGYTAKWLYSLIYKHTLGDVIQIPLGCTRTDGYGEKLPRVGELPYRDGVHIRRDMIQLNLPAYSIVNGEYQKLDPID